MKKNVLIVFIAVLSFGFIACEKDDDPAMPTSIELTVKINNAIIDNYEVKLYDSEEAVLVETLTTDANGKVSFIDIEKHLTPETDSLGYKGYNVVLKSNDFSNHIFLREGENIKEFNFLNFLGSWKIEESDAQYGFTITEVLTLTEDNFDDIISFEMGNVSGNVGGSKGTISVEGNKATLTITAVAEANINQFTGEIGPLFWHEEGSAYFNEFVASNGGNTIEAEFEVNNTELTLKIDYDGDGSFSASEEFIFTKVE